MGVTVSGPLFTGEADRALDDFCDALQREVAQQGFADVMMNLNQSIQHPTPYYETQINIRTEGDVSIVNDRGIVYGPWLEMGSYTRRTRFKGYHSFRRAKQSLERKIPGIAHAVLRRYIGRMG